MHPFFRAFRPTLHIAHRGGSALAPENTMVAFRQALTRWNTDMLELDVHLTRDGEVVVAHDDTLERCTDGSGPIAEHTYAQLCTLDAGFHFTSDGQTFPFRGQGVRVPRLAEVLEAFPRTPINLEMKTEAPGAPAALASLLKARRAADRVLCGSAQDAVAAALVAELPDAAHYYPQQALTEWVMSARAGAPVPADPRFSAIDMPYALGEITLVDASLVAHAVRDSLWLNVWTIDDAPTMRTLIALGVGGVMTDRPDTLRAVLDEAGPARL